jgi:hypothetical protein
MKRIAFVIFGFVLLQACNNHNDSIKEVNPTKNQDLAKEFNKIFKEVDSLSSFENTNFVTTLESPINKNKNSIYTATLLFAWDEIRKEIKDSIINIENERLDLMNNSKTYIGALNKNEYETSIEVKNYKIIAKAHFVKMLPFYEPLIEYQEPFSFKNTEVKSFGFRGEHKVGRIAYYINDNNFGIRLLPEDHEHEIILIKSNTQQSTLSNYFTDYESELENFKNNSIRWKHNFTHEDVVQIPLINFSIDNHYHNMINTFFSTNTGRDFTVSEAYQKTAFTLNEKGAATESYGEIIATEGVMAEGAEKPQPKHLIFNNDFVIFLKRKDADYPYFGLYITNTELMVKFENQFYE